MTMQTLTKTGCRIQLIPNADKWEGLGDGLMLTLRVPENEQYAEVFLDDDAAGDIYDALREYFGDTPRRAKT